MERLAEFDKAEDYYKQSLEIDAEYTDAFVGLGVLADLQSLPSVAVQYFEHAVTLDGYNIDYRLLLATAFIKVGQPKEAEKHFTIVLERNPKNDLLTQFHMDVAASIQSVTEEIVLSTIQYTVQKG